MPLVQAGYLVPRDVQSEFGFQTQIRPLNPGAGAFFARTTPGQFFEIPVSVFCVFTTNATVANRLVHLVVTDGDGNLVQDMPANGTQPAGQAHNYSWLLTVGSAYSPTPDVHVMPLIPFVIPSGWAVKITIGSQQVGDALTGISFVVQQFNTGIEPERIFTAEPLETGSLGIASSPIVQSPSGAPVTAQPAPQVAATQPAAPTFAEQAAAAATRIISTLPVDTGASSSAGTGGGVSRE